MRAGLSLNIYVSPHRVGTHLDEEREVTLDDIVELVGEVVAEGLVVGGVMAPRHGRVGDAAHHKRLAVEHDHLVGGRVGVRVRVRVRVGVRVRVRVWV